MKNVPQLRFVGFDGEWEDSKIQNIINVTSVKRVHKSDWATSGIPFLRARDLVSIINKTEVDEKLFISGELYNKYSKISGKVKQNDILITGVGSIGVPYLVKDNKPLYFKDGNIIWFVNDNKLDGWFFYSQLLTSRIQDYIRTSSGKGTVDTLTITTAKDINVIFPNIDEQEKIGDLFKKIDALIEIQESKVSKMKDFKKSMLQKTFPQKGELVPEFRFDGFDGEWKENKLSEIGNTYTSLSGKTAEDFGHGEASYVTYMNVYKNSIADINDLGNIEIDNKQNEVLNGDFFFTTSSETPEEVGLSSAWIYDKSNVYLNSFCFGFRPIINIDTSFFAYFFRSENFRRKVVMLAQGSTRFNISKKSVMDIIVCYPTLEEQAKIGQFFKNLDTQIENEEKLLDSYKNMKKSLLQKMFV